MMVMLNRINIKYSSQAYSPSLERQKWKEYDQKSYIFLRCTIQMEVVSFRQLNKDHLFGRNCAKIPNYLLQEEDTQVVKSKSFLCSKTETATHTVLPKYEE